MDLAAGINGRRRSPLPECATASMICGTIGRIIGSVLSRRIEEGTEIETGIDNCVNVKASIKDEQLTWTIPGSENTIDHYTILAQQASQWINVAELPAGSNAAKLTALHLQPESRALCVEAVGKASMLNHFSGPINYSPAKSQSQTP